MNEDRELVEALNQVERAIQPMPTTRGALPDFKAVCDNYRSIKPTLERALPLIEKIPVYGAKIVTAIKFLMAVANVACPAEKAAG